MTPREDLVESSAPFLPEGSEIRQVFICQAGGARPQSLVGTMPRHTQLGPVSGRWAQIVILGERHWVHKRFHPCIAAADHEAGFAWEQVS